MLTADLVQARRQAGTLVLPALVGKTRARLLELAEEVLSVIGAGGNASREELWALWNSLGSTPTDRKLSRGLAKLVEDGSTFTEAPEGDAEAVRDALFLAAAEGRRRLGSSAGLDCPVLCQEVARTHGWDAATLLDRLYSDLPSAQRLVSPAPYTAELLVDHYDDARIQAVLLRAVRLEVEIGFSSPVLLRALFRALKFRRLLYRIVSGSRERTQLVIDGPYSLFEAVTKYGLALALVWPHLAAADTLKLAAELRWGARRERLDFRLERDKPRHHDAPVLQQSLSEVEELCSSLGTAQPPFSIEPGGNVLDVPGVGLCVPDLTCVFLDGQRVHVEVLGYWSRDSVWQRVTLVEAGLPEPVLFVASSRLRVSERVLEDREQGALYVFKGKISPRVLVERVERLARLAKRRMSR